MSGNIEQVKLGYLAQIDERIKGLNGHAQDASNSLQVYAREVFETAEFPGRKDEDWKYTPVRPILSKLYEPTEAGAGTFEYPEQFDAYTFHFVNGHLVKHPRVLPEGVFAGRFTDAWEQDALKDQLHALTSQLKITGIGPFESMAMGLSIDPICVFVARNTALDKPLHFVYEVTSSDPFAAHPYHVISIGKSAQATLIESFLRGDNDTEYYTNAGNRIFLAENSGLTHYRLQAESYKAFHTSHTTVMQERDSHYGIYIAELGSKLMRHNLHIEHKGENISSNIYGLFISRDSQHIDTQSFIDHAMPHCESNELFKGILLDRGRGVFNGKIIVRQDAQKINAYQQNAALVLSKDAVMDSKPQLEIYADDVRCSHGATIGQLDQDALFYLKTRGLKDADAKALLKRAFLKDVVDQFPDEKISEFFLGYVEEELQAISKGTV